MYLYRRPRSRRPVLARRRGRRSDLVDFKLLRAPRALVMMRIWHCLVPARNVLQISRAPGAVLHLWLRSRPGYFLELRRSCSRGLLLLILCRDARCSRGFGCGAVPFARIACRRERASPTATGGCEEPAAAQASDVHGLAALDDRAADGVDGFVAGDGDAGAADHCASVAPGGLPPSVAMAVTNSRPKADALRDAVPRDDGAKPKVGRRAASR